MATEAGPAATYRVLALDDVGSTNTYALALAGRGETGPLWVTAKRQTQGRGRSGRGWTSVDGNLYASFLATLTCPPSVVPQLSLVAGVAVHDAISRAVGAGGERIDGLRLKWPNDVLVGRAKVAGILPESMSRGSGPLSVVIGVGLNLAGAPTGMGSSATHLGASGLSIGPGDMLEGYLHPALVAALGTWDEGRGFETIRRGWLERAGPIGEAMAINVGSGPVTGTFGGLDRDGALLLREGDNEIRRYTYGDVTVTAPADGQTGDGAR